MKKKPAITAKTETVLELLKRKKTEGIGEFILPVSGITCVMSFFSTKTARDCQEIATSGTGENAKMNEELMYAAMASESCTFNGEKMLGEDIILYLHGIDFLTIQGKLAGASSQEDSKSS